MGNQFVKGKQILSKIQKQLSLRQTYLFLYALQHTNEEGVAKFNQADFEQQNGFREQDLDEWIEDLKAFAELRFEFQREENRYTYFQVFSQVNYNAGVLGFAWSSGVLPAMLKWKKQQPLLMILDEAKNFNSLFSWMLFEYLMMTSTTSPTYLTKEELLSLFEVEDVKSYLTNTSVFMRNVLDVAVTEINQHTGLTVTYTPVREGRTIKGFDLTYVRNDVAEVLTEIDLQQAEELYDQIRIQVSSAILLDDEALKQQVFNVYRAMEKRLKHPLNALPQIELNAMYVYMREAQRELTALLSE